MGPAECVKVENGKRVHLERVRTLQLSHVHPLVAIKHHRVAVEAEVEHKVPTAGTEEAWVLQPHRRLADFLGHLKRFRLSALATAQLAQEDLVLEVVPVRVVDYQLPAVRVELHAGRVPVVTFVAGEQAVQSHDRWSFLSYHPPVENGDVAVVGHRDQMVVVRAQVEVPHAAGRRFLANAEPRNPETRLPHVRFAKRALAPFHVEPYCVWVEGQGARFLSRSEKVVPPHRRRPAKVEYLDVVMPVVGQQEAPIGRRGFLQANGENVTAPRHEGNELSGLLTEVDSSSVRGFTERVQDLQTVFPPACNQQPPVVRPVETGYQGVEVHGPVVEPVAVFGLDPHFGEH